MSKLRVIKERKDTANFEQDLRGLDSKLLNNIQPQPFLAIHDLSSNADLSFIEKYGCVMQKKQSTVIITKKIDSTNYKTDSVHLFYAAMSVIGKNLATKIELSENNRLRNEIENAINNSHTKEPTVNLSEILDSGFHISGMQSHALNQAGFNIAAHEEKLVLSLDSVKSIISHLKSESSVSYKNRRSA